MKLKYFLLSVAMTASLAVSTGYTMMSNNNEEQNQVMCPICEENTVDQDNTNDVLDCCQQLMCPQCQVQWLTQSDTCPYCRRTIIQNNPQQQNQPQQRQNQPRVQVQQNRPQNQQQQQNRDNTNTLLRMLLLRRPNFDADTPRSPWDGNGSIH